MCLMHSASSLHPFPSQEENGHTQTPTQSILLKLSETCRGSSKTFQVRIDQDSGASPSNHHVYSIYESNSLISRVLKKFLPLRRQQQVLQVSLTE
jgi:hypothetical protein